MFVNKSVAVQWQWKIFLRSHGFNMVFGRNAGEEKEMAVFNQRKKESKFCEKSYPEDFKRAKRKISGNIYKANLGFETLIPLSLLSWPLQGDSPECYLRQLFGFWSASFPGGVSLFRGEEGQSLNKPCSSVNWKNTLLNSLKVKYCFLQTIMGSQWGVLNVYKKFRVRLVLWGVWFEFSPNRLILCFISMVVFHYITFKQLGSNWAKRSGSNTAKFLGFSRMGFF